MIRREFCSHSGLACLALASLFRQDTRAFAQQSTSHTPTPDPSSPLSKLHPAKAKSVIWLFMNGGLSHMESFDPKPMLNRYAGKTIAETPFASVQDPNKLAIERLVVPDANGNQRHTLYPLQVGFRKYGASGIEVSDWFPFLGEQVDKLAIVRSMWTTDSNHGAQTQFHSGRHQNDGDFPTLGAWVHYGLGSLNEELPQFVSMGTREYWNKRDGHYLGPAHDAIPLRVDPENPLDYAKSAQPLHPQARLIAEQLQRDLAHLRLQDSPHDADLQARIASYELAYRMQNSIPQVIDCRDETAETLRLYGIDRPGNQDYAKQLLVARRLVERGVRFIQIQHGGGGAGAWDAHGGLKANHAANALAVDQPTAGLLVDLERRGLLDETLVVFATEFGRTPGSQGSDGRDHHIFGFSVWMAGGGLQRGVTHGETDEIGFHASVDRHYVTDIHATILHQLGLNPRDLEIPGRKRLEIDFGKPISAIL